MKQPVVGHDGKVHGSTLRANCMSLQKFGACDERMYRYTEDNVRHHHPSAGKMVLIF